MGESQKWDLEQKGPDTKNVHLHEVPKNKSETSVSQIRLVRTQSGMKQLLNKNHKWQRCWHIFIVKSTQLYT